MSPPPAMTDRSIIRKHLRAVRAAMDEVSRTSAAAAATERLVRHPRFHTADRVATYFASNHELDPGRLKDTRLGRRKDWYLPVLHPCKTGRLWFCRWRDDGPLKRNKFGIPEPPTGEAARQATWSLDLVVVPLLGFDSDCHRLGMGGGFYDRSFAFLQRFEHMQRPCLIGLAFECQRVESLSTERWDVQLDAVVTERATYRCKRAPKSP